MPDKPPGLTPEHNPGGARWCDTHRRMECTKNRTKGRGPCHKPATRGTNSCDNHSGHTRELAHALGDARLEAWSPMGQQQGVDAGAAVLGVLRMTWHRLAWVTERLRRQVVADGGALLDGQGEEVAEGETIKGLIGHRYGMGGKDGILYVQTEELRALVQLEAAERDRVVKYAKVAHDMGISERMTSVAERWTEIVATRVSLVLEGLELTPEQAVKVPSLLHTHLGSIDIDDAVIVDKSGT